MTRHRHRAETRRERARALAELRASWLIDGQAPLQMPPHDSRSHDRLAERTGLTWTTDGTSWLFDSIDERRRFVADAHDWARDRGAATSALQTLRCPL